MMEKREVRSSERVNSSEGNNNPEQTFERVSKKLDSLAESAKEVGPEAVNYLASDLYLKASAASHHGDFQTAVLLYKHLIKIKSEDTFLKKKLAIELIRVGELQVSKKLLEELFKGPLAKDAELGLVLGGVYVALEQNVKARSVYRQLLRADPRNVDACLFLVKSWVLDKAIGKAMRQVERCERRDKAEGTYAFFKGKLYLELDKRKKAEQEFRRALKINPEYFQAALGLGLLREDQQDYKTAIKVYKQYLDRDPDNEMVLRRIVQLLFALSRFDEVIPYAESLTYLDPSNLNLKIKLGILYSDAKLYRKAIAQFEEILEVVPDSDKILYYMGAIHQEMQEFSRAIQYYGKIKTDSSLYIDSSLQIAHILQAMAMQKREEAVQRFFSFIDERGSHSEELNLELAVVKATWYENQGEVSQAINTLSDVKGLPIFKENHKYYLASLYEKQRDFKLSYALIEEILEENPNNAHALNFLGYSILENGNDAERAYNLISRAVEIEPNDGYIRDSLGWYFYKMGEYTKALMHLRKAYNQVNDDGVISKHLGMVYQKLRQYKKAQKFYRLSLEHSRQDNEKNSVQQEIEQIDEMLRKPASSP